MLKIISAVLSAVVCVSFGEIVDGISRAYAGFLAAILISTFIYGPRHPT
jgi:hypothetical protein